MKLGKVESKKTLGIFEVHLKNDIYKNELVSLAADYWADAIANAGERQINYQIGNGMIVLSDKDLNKFKKSFVNYILKNFHLNESIMIWTSDGDNFKTIGTDSYLPVIMRNCNLPLTCLPSDVCMFISSDKIVVENNFEQEIIYSKDKKIKMGFC